MQSWSHSRHLLAIDGLVKYVLDKALSLSPEELRTAEALSPEQFGLLAWRGALTAHGRSTIQACSHMFQLMSDRFRAIGTQQGKSTMADVTSHAANLLPDFKLVQLPSSMARMAS